MDASIASLDSSLRWIAAGLAESGWAAELCDADWRLVWMSDEARKMLDDPDLELIGVGRHLLESRLMPAWDDLIDRESRIGWAAANLPQMVADGDLERLAEAARGIEAFIGDSDVREFLRGLEPATIPVWTGLLRFAGDTDTRYFGARLRAADGTPIATVYLYGSPLPATLLALVSAGNREMFERMARLTQPGTREAAVLFGDLQASGALSRRLPSAAYFELMRELTTAMDAVVIDNLGIVGKHAGDGIVAFFLAEDLGSASAAARAALQAARGFAAVARETAARLDGVEAADLRINVGAHWGGTLYMGQVVTGGRLEVTALGDEVNECARIQQAASDGQALASKSIVERLSTSDAAQLGIDPARVSYRAVAELPGAEGKIVRDAGSIAVTALPS